MPYVVWVLAFAAFSCFVSNMGLDAILAFSVPLLAALYPPAIVLVVMGMLRRVFDRFRWSWPLAVGMAAVVSVGASLCDVLAPDAWTVFDALPLADVGMGWAAPALVGLGAGMAASALGAGRRSGVRGR